MKELMFKDCEFCYGAKWLGVKDLKVGYVYVVKDGKIAMYLGKTELDMHCFYAFCKIQFKTLPNFVLSFSNYEVQVAGVVNMCKELMNRPAYPESVMVLKNLPKIYCEFPFVNFEESYSLWYTKSRMVHKDLPSLCAISNTKPNSVYVGARDLIPGHLYYTSSCWRSVYVYLGRTSSKEFLWYFVGSTDKLLGSTAYNLILNAERLKSNKKVKPLKMALTDPKAVLDDEVRKLINMEYCVNMDGVTQEMLDNGGTCYGRNRW